MAASTLNDSFARAPLSPEPDTSDGEDVVVALRTARALEGQGDVGTAVVWLRRAAEAAEREGDDRRTLALARAAADLTSTISAPPTIVVTPLALVPPLPQGGNTRSERPVRRSMAPPPPPVPIRTS